MRCGIHGHGHRDFLVRDSEHHIIGVVFLARRAHGVRPVKAIDEEVPPARCLDRNRNPWAGGASGSVAFAYLVKLIISVTS